MMRAIAAAMLFTIACSADQADDKVPTLEVTSPARGTLADSDQVTVTGRVTDDGAVKVTVAGTDVAVAKDGTFSATITVPPGIAIIETHAVDGAGHDVRDVRSVLSGELAPSDGSTGGQVGARAGASALTAIGHAIGEQAKAIDYTAAAQALNPVYNNDGCLGAQINITSVTLSDVNVALAPKPDLLSTDVAITNLDVRMNAKFKVACIGGSTTITVKASKTKIHGDLGAQIASGKISTSLPTTTVAFDNFSVDVGGVPGAIESLLKDEARKGVEKALSNAIKSKVPPIANSTLSGLIAKPLNTSILGNDTTISIVPSKISITATELFIGIDSKLKVTGGEGGTFLTTPTTISPTAMTGNGLGVALDDDLVNGLFAGLWAADSFDKSISVDSIPALGALLDDDARTIELSASLPPTVSTAGGELELALGDLIITVKDEAGATVHQIALSVRTSLSAAPSQSGKIILTVGAPTVFAQVLENSEAVEKPLTDEHVEALITGVWGLVGVKADEALSNLPMPTIAGIELGAPTVEAGEGLLLANIPVM